MEDNFFKEADAMMSNITFDDSVPDYSQALKKLEVIKQN